MDKKAPKLDSSTLASRLRAYQTRPVQRVEPRQSSRYVSKVVINDVYNSQGLLLTPNKQTERIAPVTQKAKTLPKAASSPQIDVKTIDFEKNAEAWKQSRKNKRNVFLSFRRYLNSNSLLTAMAVMLFIVGLAATFHSFMTNNRITAVVEAQANTSESDVDESVPTDDDLRNHKVSAEMPRFITLPKFDVTARVTRVGLDKNGNLDAPKNIHDAAWFSDSVLPGSPGGASIIDGHVSGPTRPGVFKNLDKLSQGDTIFIEKGSGQKLTYRVVKSEVADVESIDMAKMLLPVTTGKHGLNLISCTGKYNAQTKQYEQRVMVFAEFVQ